MIIIMPDPPFNARQRSSKLTIYSWLRSTGLMLSVVVFDFTIAVTHTMPVEGQDFLAYSTNPVWESSEPTKFLASFPSLLPTNSKAHTPWQPGHSGVFQHTHTGRSGPRR
ncbi:hypothetical protein LB503_012312 [Fusarium chuoi]|nr:hypothetical protein LB503_012312 [Fusarium chuoi]